ncbi:MAG: sigma-54-dependent Fis family transcriptional regulator [Acidobacteria bacterium]|nr:sigma-54-dependent Fis family transcriptional regulator [Acidobacteriota bacterium]
MDSPRILLVDDDPGLLDLVSELLARRGHEVVQTGSGLRAAQLLKAERFDLAVLDLLLPDLSGLDLAQLALRDPDTVVVVLSGSTSVEQALQAMRIGIYDYVIKPFQVEQLEHTLQRALEKVRLNKENKRLRHRLDGEDDRAPRLVGSSTYHRQLMDLAGRVASSGSTVLVTGPSGTGKELVARAIHAASPRSKQPFVAIHCGAIPESLLEDELFGHVRGAYTDARSDRPGRFLQADGGTLFLDEIGTMPASLQVKLLRVLQEREVTPLGSDRSVRVDVRVIAATNEDLQARVADRSFREDLFYRLNVVPIQLRALKEHPEDVAGLTAHFVRQFARRMGKPLKQVDPEALRALEAYGWPGNVRELENAIERAMALGADAERLRLDDLPAAVAGSSPAMPSLPSFAAGSDLPAFLLEVERRSVQEALSACLGNKSEAARRLGMARTTLIHRIKALGLPEGSKEAR